jgi:hypothetical protein
MFTTATAVAEMHRALELVKAEAVEVNGLYPHPSGDVTRWIVSCLVTSGPMYLSVDTVSGDMAPHYGAPAAGA